MPARKNHPDADYVDEILDRLSAFAPVSSRFMFGSFGLYVDGAMFGLVIDGALCLRADEVNRPAFEAAGLQPWVYESKGKRVTMPYYPIPEDDFDDTEALRAWFEGARAATSRSRGGSRL